VAERVGFEPTVGVNPRLISSQVHSTTLPPLRSQAPFGGAILGKMEPERITFPTEYPIKVIARAEEGLRERLDEIFVRYFGDFEEERVKVRPSGQKSFVAYTYHVTVQAESQLGPLHTDLRALDGVIMVL
jgi:uncharacterized protein